MGIVEEDIVKVREATDFIALAQEHIGGLKRNGANYSGLCPFHTEKTPSFSISPAKGFYYCFGCQASGDVIRFVMEVEHLDFVTAVEKLAGKAGVTVRHDDTAVSRDRQRRNRLTEILERAVDFYHEQLLTTAGAGAARRYLRDRGYDGDTVRAFRLGWSPDSWDTLCKKLNLTPELAKDTGLGLVNKLGRLNDFFRGRIMFPIFDASGSAVGFGGRVMPGGEGPKYRNSSETPVYSKSRVLYGLNWAKSEVARVGEVIVCEGYTDVIAFHRAGVPRAVATCGTALADEHFRMLKNYARRIVLAYDADAAGQNAAEKFFEWERRYEIDLAVVALPPGTDPADLARTDPAALAQAVADARPFLAFRVERVLAAANLSTPEGRGRAFEQAAAAVLSHPSEYVREDYLRQVAARCLVSEEAMARLLHDPAAIAAARAAGRAGSSSTGGSAAPSVAGSGPGTAAVGRAGHGATGSGPSAGGAGSSGAGSSGAASAPRRVPNEAPEEFDRSDEGRGRQSGAQNRRPRSEAVHGRASSAETYGTAASKHAGPVEIEALRHAAQHLHEIDEWLDAQFFTVPLHFDAFTALREAGGDVNRAEYAAQEGDREELAAFLRRLAVEPTINDEPAEAAARLVRTTANRLFAALTHADSTQDFSDLGRYKPVLDLLDDPTSRPGALNQLVPFLSSWGTPPITAIP